ncbi:MAG: Zn-dependent exopeptidase M28 [Clostridiales bacterium]|nr:Zn-dependent exopeptidase M28 [Clostridiales bacterium]
MTLKHIKKILRDTFYVHTGGSAEELKAAEYLAAECESMGVKARIEPFKVQMAEIKSASLTADGTVIPCRGYRNCGSGSVEAPLLYLPNTDEVSISAAKGKIVMLDTILRHFTYQDLLDAGAVGFITYDGNVNFADRDIDAKELRSFVAEGRKVLCASVNAKDAFKIVSSGAKTAKIEIEQDEWEGDSRNVIADIPGESGEWIVLTAHYDTVPLSRGSYDNMSGCVGLLETMDALRGRPHRYGLRFIFCGSEERGLLGSKAYTAAHEEELKKVVLNINVDMIGSVMGSFLACVTAEEGLTHFIRYFAGAKGWGINPYSGVYSSDSTPFADHGVPAVSFARGAPGSQSNIHSRYDTYDLLSERQIRDDAGFIAGFTAFMADSFKCPVKREIPDKIKDDLDKYLNRKR